MRQLPILRLLFAGPLPRRLWMVGLAAALFILTMAVGNGLLPAEKALTPDDMGLDFLPFYTGASFVRAGATDRIYDLPSLYAAEQATAQTEHLALGDRAGGPFWNPPFYAALLSPLAELPYRRALLVWTMINIAALLLAMRLLVRMLPPQATWQTQALVPLLVLVSMPFVQAISHGQNTFMSLLLVTMIVTLWRARRAVLAGAVCGLLFYKPQLAAVAAIVLAVDLGWRAGAAAATVGLAFVLICLAMPGSDSMLRPPLALHADAILPRFVRDSALADYSARLGGIVTELQENHPYAWERHATLLSLTRMLGQGSTTGPTQLAARLATLAIGAMLAASLVLAVRRSRPIGSDDCWTGLTPAIRRDRLIAATICCTPLLVPFYFDYDLLLLAVPAVLLAAERLAPVAKSDWTDQWSVRTFCVLAFVLMFNIAISKATGINFAALLLLIEALLLLRRATWVVEPHTHFHAIAIRRILHLRSAA
jgi:hypothetical protein